ncbi:hypothetical protein NW765_016884 [Fusarium oxysporum]|nr:hypothetical protein NW765_016884 [Fusarium oxysporum]KAJ4277805.1 hypothetical protein NW764_007838 [Fusarium oxysporum]RKK47838.1 hypothetical protein BFJ67_g7636 [Fusarium oxysporum f. sp. cepae]RKK94107.1 hypothetical protein BFJ71_g9242 [Fusarium oxysporum]
MMSFLSSHVRDAPAVFALSLLNRRILNIPKSPVLVLLFLLFIDHQPNVVSNSALAFRQIFLYLFSPYQRLTCFINRSPRNRRRSLRLALINAYRAQAQAYLVCESAARGQATLEQWQRALARWQEAQAWIVWLRRQQLAGL